MSVHIIPQLNFVEFVVRTGSVRVSGLVNDNLTHFINENALGFGEEPQRCQCLSSNTLNKFLQVKLLVDLDLGFANQSLIFGMFAALVKETLDQDLNLGFRLHAFDIVQFFCDFFDQHSFVF